MNGCEVFSDSFASDELLAMCQCQYPSPKLILKKKMCYGTAYDDVTFYNIQ